MIPEESIRNNIDNTIADTDFSPLGKKYTGKVRDMYTLGDKIVIIVTDRISAFDKVLGTIPFKGQVLNQIAAYWFEATKDIVPNHVVSVVDPNVMVVRMCTPFPIEMIVRGYITGSLWRAYEKGEDPYGLSLPAGLKKDQKLDAPLLTPSTKASEGHDLPLTRDAAVRIVGEGKYAEIERMALALYARGSEISLGRGLILVDTKYEFGEAEGKVLVIDEIHTPDSSRYWIADGYDELFGAGKSQQMLDKEYVRQWLMERGFMGDGEIPRLPEEVVVTAARKYIELYEQVTGKQFVIIDGNVQQRIKENLINKGYSV
jgi:phosphoribosylaminoimidazole-succinocarboxamide synthase